MQTKKTNENFMQTLTTGQIHSFTKAFTACPHLGSIVVSKHTQRQAVDGGSDKNRS